MGLSLKALRSALAAALMTGAVLYVGWGIGVTAVNFGPLERNHPSLPGQAVGDLTRRVASSHPKKSTCWAAAKLLSYTRFQAGSDEEVRLRALPIFPFAYLRGRGFCANAVVTLAPTRYSMQGCFSISDSTNQAECLVR
jgi:hypothetical protein